MRRMATLSSRKAERELAPKTSVYPPNGAETATKMTKCAPRVPLSTIDRGTIQAAIGTAKKADLAVEAPFDVWMDIVTKKADGARSFIDGKYEAAGDLTLMGLFGRER